MSRRLRSGRNYDASKVPTAPKRRADKRMAPKTANRVGPETSNKTTDEQAIVPARRVQLTFGTMPQGAREPGERMVVLVSGSARE
ncbi:hypothetical protein RHS01_00155 [Rhizoctonia solani]|uniref:Uncharacterized protein n=1 Tax=Rhizoctonia solani TaxID=456999 RepID=A0A8H7IN39_9AGAM|nr:hypothetical protein RHS01_00155 [Rhizoctonia solani]